MGPQSDDPSHHWGHHTTGEWPTTLLQLARQTVVVSPDLHSIITPHTT